MWRQAVAHHAQARSTVPHKSGCCSPALTMAVCGTAVPWTCGRQAEPSLPPRAAGAQLHFTPLCCMFVKADDQIAS